MPEQYGGYGMDFNTSMLIAEEFGKAYSFAVTITAHTGIGTLPILYYGNDEQKACRLKKALYGLKQAPRAWYSRLDAYLKKLQFKKSSVDSNLYVLETKEGQLITIVYVDDMLMLSRDPGCE